MQTLTFTQQLLRRSRFISSAFIPLLVLLAGLSASRTALAQGYNTNNLTIIAQPTSASATTTTTYDGLAPDPPVVNASFNGVDLGNGTSFSQATGTLTLSAAFADVNTTEVRPIVSSRIEYRVFVTGTTSALPSFSVVNLPRTSANDFGSSVTFNNSAANVNLLTQPNVLGGGNYTVEVRFVSVRRSGLGTVEFTNPGTATNYRATFQVLAPPTTPAGGTTTWISDGIAPKDTDWLNPLNWSNGVPTRNSSAIIPGKAPSDPFTVSPLLNNPNALYEVQNLTLQNADNNFRAIVRVGQSTGGTTVGATLRIYGNLDNLGGGILAAVSGTNGSPNPATNSTVVFAGDATTSNLDSNGVPVLTGGNQIIRGLTTVVDVRIEGTGIKGVVNVIQATNTLTFATVNAIVRTVFDDATFTLNTSKTANVDLGSSGFLFNETRNAFVEGITLASRTLQAGVAQRFGNIGVDITPDRDIPAPAVIITRTIGAAFVGPVGMNGAPVAVKRQYGVSGDVNNNTRSTVVFHYLDSNGANSTFNELNGNPEPNLVIFRTSNNGIPFQLVGGTVDLDNNTVTQVNVNPINTVTLGDRDNPLPVTLISFDAKRTGADVAVTWATASELNNKGFNVQVSSDGKTYRTLGFVPSTSPNSTRLTNYSYVDTEKNKTGLRYYRLKQLDVDGKSAYSAPRVASFEGKAAEANQEALAYPNPFISDIRLSLRSSDEGLALVRIADMTGRVVGQRQLSLGAGSNDVEVSNLGDLKAGTYLVRVTLPTGETRNLRVVKQ